MAKPRIFVSSTFYDLRHIRDDLEHFIRELGFDPVLHERGGVPYGHEEPLERYCLREIGNCDILVSIVGSRFGSASLESEYSISQMELKTAVELNKPIYVFIENGVLAEFRTYQANRETKGIRYASVDDARVFKFIEEIGSLPNNNPMFPFSSSIDITRMLREQWSGLFRKLAIRDPQAGAATRVR